jgi:hypothetical protein
MYFALQTLLGVATGQPAAAQTALQELLLRLQQQQQQPGNSDAQLPFTAVTIASSTVEDATPEAAAVAAAAEQAARQAVQQIRADEFGIGVALQGAAHQLMAAQNARLGRALQRLSQELYSSNTHFVLELVQVGRKR